MAQYTYLFADLMSGKILDELPLVGVSFGKSLNDAGSLRGTLPVGDQAVRDRAPRLLTEPARTAVYVDRDGVLVWGGIVWTSRYSAGGERLEIGAADFFSYLEHRRVLAVGSPDPVTFDDDQLVIARGLLALAQAHPGGDLGIVPRGPSESGQRRQVTYHRHELKPVAEALTTLAEADGGFDFVFDVAYGPDGSPERRMLLGYPRLGQAGTPHVWEFGAGLSDFTWPRDGSAMATRVFAKGAGSEADQLIAAEEDTAAYPNGWPLLEQTVSHLDVEDAGALAALARAELAARRRPVVLPDLVVRADHEPELGTYTVGDDARIIVDDPFLGGPLDVIVRILGFEVTPGDDSETEQVKLTVTPVEEDQ